jgi:AraC-like DNA-binding protein
MLMYFNRGSRTFVKSPRDVSLRHNWEFYAIISGRAAPYFSKSERLQPSTATLWLIAPQKEYTWWGDAGSAERIVFHFSAVDESLRLLMTGRNLVSISLGKKTLTRLIRIADEVEPHYQRLSRLSPLYFSKAQAELSLMIAESCCVPDNEVMTLSTKNQIMARRALAFYESQIPRRPTIDEVAAAVGVSATHLRRVFLEVFHHPPKHLFLIAQLERAKSIAAQSDMLLNDVAKLSGFIGAPHLCSVFQKYHHITFSKWRTQLVNTKMAPHLRTRALGYTINSRLLRTPSS